MKSHQEHEHTHEHTLMSELMCHLPYAIFSVAFALVILSFLGFSSAANQDQSTFLRSMHTMFHSFHFMHIVFATTGCIITFLRFNKSVIKGLLVGLFVPSFFCIFSDSILPYIGGRLLGVPMHFHLCFVSELANVLPFLFVGLLNGVIMSKHHSSQQGFYSVSSHFVHILVSSLASSFYLVSHGFTNWYSSIGVVFLFLIFAVVIPCTLSDVVIPMMFARGGKKDEKYQH